MNTRYQQFKTNLLFAFAISMTEVNKYFTVDATRKCKGTEYCNSTINPNDVTWWLRSPGNESYFAAVVNGDFGNINGFGRLVTYELGVRPALWISIDSDTSQNASWKCTGNNVNVRVEPSMNGRSIGRLMKNDPLTVLEDNGEWSKISCSFGTGYIRSQYITKE